MPFIETAYLGAPGADVFEDGDNIHHCAGVRLRVIGAGNLIPTLQNMEEENIEELQAVTMQASTPDVVEKLANFVDQRMSLRLETLEINEIFRISRITFYVKPMYTSWPG